VRLPRNGGAGLRHHAGQEEAEQPSGEASGHALIS
jgi:hypothetical protein